MTDRLKTPLRVELQDDRNSFKLISPLEYLDPGHGLIQVPANFLTDFASLRGMRTAAVALLVLGALLSALSLKVGALVQILGFVCLALYAAVVNYGQVAATLHDWLYTCCDLPRAAADQVFYNALRSTGHARWRARLMWAGVRLGGHFRYGK